MQHNTIPLHHYIMLLRLTTTAALMMVAAAPCTRALSTGVAAQTTTVGWSDVAIKAAKDFTVKRTKELRTIGALDVQRPIKITGERPIVGTTTTDSSLLEEDDCKIIHFQRHGQGYHNLICDIYREWDKPIDFESKDPMLNPAMRSEILDPPLTHTGIQQCKARRNKCSQLNPELIIVSPLLRCLQTAKLSFRDHHSGGAVPWVAHEGCREELGQLIGNKRRPLTDIKEDYPDIDFSPIQHEEDVLWENYNGEGETLIEQSGRIYEFLTEFVATRPEKEIAIVCHSAYLFTLLNAVMDIEEEELRSWFLTSEVRSIKMRFSKNEEY